MAISGIKILEIAEGSPAEKLGLRPGDRILAVNGHDVSDELALKFFLAEDAADLHIQRPTGARKRF
jgi:C-terminal processing protease CtpA/Prc